MVRGQPRLHCANKAQNFVIDFDRVHIVALQKRLRPRMQRKMKSRHHTEKTRTSSARGPKQVGIGFYIGTD
jgi:hypothetical protein